MSRELNPAERVIKDISMLYELALAVGQSLDLQDNCDYFFKRLMGRRDFKYCALWLQDRQEPREEDDPAGLKLAYSYPQQFSATSRLRRGHPLEEEIPPCGYRLFSLTHDPCSSLLVSSVPRHGYLVVCSLGEKDRLLLVTSGRDDGISEEMDRLMAVINKFALSVQACLAQEALLKESAERRRMLEELRRKEERLARAQLFGRMGSWEYDVTTGKIFWSRECACLFGLPPEEMVIGYDYFLTFVHPEDLAEVRNINEPVTGLKTGGYLRYDHRIIRRDGCVRWLREEAGPVYSHSGRLEKVVGMVIDITEQREAENELWASNERLRGILESQRDLIVRVDRENRFLYVNDAYCQKFGKKREDLLGSFFSPLVHPEDLESTLEIMAGLDQEPYRVYVEQRAMTVEGWRWLSWEDSAVRNPAGEIIEIQGVGRDITSRKAAEAELREREDLQALLMKMATAFINVPPERTAAAIDEMLETVGVFVGVDRVYIFEHDYERAITANTHEWCAPGISPQIENLQETPFDFFQDILEAHNEGKSIYIPSVEGMSLQDPMREILGEQGILSVVLLPLVSGQDNHGFVGFDAVREKRVFREHEINLLQVLGGIIANAISRQRMEKALLESEERFRAISEMALDAVIMIDEKGRVVYWSPSAEKTFGYAAGEVQGRDVHRLLMPSRYGEKQKQGFSAFRVSGKGHAVGRVLEMTALHREGREIPVEIAVSPIKVGSGYWASAIIRDITERKEAKEILERKVTERTAELQAVNKVLQEEIGERLRAEEALAEEKEFLQVTLESIGEGVIITDRQGQVRMLNRRAEAICAREEAGARGRPLAEVLTFAHDDSRQGKGADGDPLQRLGVPRAPAEGIYRGLLAADGTRKLLSCHGTVIRDREGDCIGYVVSFQDVTLLKKLEARLALTRKLESIGQLAAGVAHEMNTPMQYIGDNTRFLKDAFMALSEALCVGQSRESCLENASARPEDGELHYYLSEGPLAIDQTLEGIDRIVRLISAMKTLSRSSTRGKEPADLNRAISDAVIVSRNEWKYKAEIKEDLDPSLPLVSCNIDEITQVLLNLIVNAAHAVNDCVDEGRYDGGEIRLSSRREADRVIIEVADNGCGIPEQYLEQVFDPFFTTKEVDQGSGQGLMIAHDLVVNKHGGDIEVQSEAGRGTVFTITLPL